MLSGARLVDVTFTEVNLFTHPKAWLKLVFQWKRFGPTIVVGEQAIGPTNRKRLARALGLPNPE